ncbi:hypothetical protein BO71DRAFT_441891 [Aspergillus ellipticus CBS 707.79]|uniref:Uncharacterized protein n=1 Tax=Aspergillus ellipticus CBS 707.79 TaxID=1448320 RepID=A0A319DPM2_9EURO|nr:hypothetical protein BO71DRAFT_441891 [Aspergillus ellipticus CBS 707.79]
MKPVRKTPYMPSEDLVLSLEDILAAGHPSGSRGDDTTHLVGFVYRGSENLLDAISNIRQSDACSPRRLEKDCHHSAQQDIVIQGCGEQGFPSAQPYLSHTPGGSVNNNMTLVVLCPPFVFLYPTSAWIQGLERTVLTYINNFVKKVLFVTITGFPHRFETI